MRQEDVKAEVDLGKYQKCPRIKLSALQKGDLLFAINPPNPDPAHVSIVSRHHVDTGAVRSVHEVLGGGAEGLHETDVVPRNLVVVRCKNATLANVAAAWADFWVRDKPAPYAALRLDIAREHENANKSTLVKTHRLLFQTSGKFRAIKYTARRFGNLTYPSDKDPRLPGNRGMFCSMFVALCYQVAGLEQVVSIAPSETRVSDKKMTRQDMKRYQKECESLNKVDYNEFLSYTGNLHESDPYKLGTPNALFGRKTKEGQEGSPKNKHFEYRPSLEYWRSPTPINQFDWAAHITKGMMLDAKVIMPVGMLACLEEDVVDWEIVGVLEDEFKFSENKEEKKLRMDIRNKELKTKFHL